ncbi:hypothetical protein [Dictyobacter formicarum]|uniref:Transposase IS701-like DDE domain-containing protein n=1 Tax=Dictyobacter formicarum TaxID=2778368 RepID=A0ABQ3VBP7_9CHLR|nr:hypothetical protein [Dictyobacter formicarum]GHO82636.1 hypothetical protein KSZ_06420 [Dictyobacter formicarum]
MWDAGIDWADEKPYTVVIDDVGHQRGTYSKAHRRSACIKPLRNAPQ